MINIGIIGCGYWGPNLLRNFLDCPHCKVKMVAEFDKSRRDYVKEKYPQIVTTSDYKSLFSDEIDAIVIATPAQTHYKLAQEALKNKKNVLVEKPLAMSAKDAKHLIALARKNKCKLMVGHTFEYNKAVQELKKQIKSGTIGTPYYLYSQRLNFGIVRQDINALWNLAPHDISIFLYLLEEMPVSVSARGYDFIQPDIEDVVFISLQFPGDIAAHIQVSWLDPSKLRKMTVVGSKRMIIYDDMADAKIKIFDKGIRRENIKDSLGRFDDFKKYQLLQQAGDVTIPKINFVEPLREECAHFVECILKNKQPLTDGENGLRVVKVLEAAQRSLKTNGKNINL